MSIPAVMTDPWVAAHGLSVKAALRYWSGHHHGRAWRAAVTDARVVPGRPAATPGADAQAVLARVGLADALGRLCEDAVILVEPSPQEDVQPVPARR